MNEFAINIKKVSKSYKNIQALDGVTLKIKKGKIFGLLGPNGAGKTTLIKILATLIQPEEGDANILGRSIVKEPNKIRDLISFAGQYAAVDENLTGRENLHMFGQLYRLPFNEVKKRSTKILDDLLLSKDADRLVKGYSGGMRRRLDLGVSLVSKPKILFLDEPTTGLDPRTRLELWEIIREIESTGTTIVLTTQYLEEADNLASNIAILDKGKIVAEGSPSELKAKIGGHVLEIALSNDQEFKQTKEIFSAIQKNFKEDKFQKRIWGQVENGPESLSSILKILNSKKIKIIDIQLRRPSLDEVFLKITN